MPKKLQLFGRLGRIETNVLADFSFGLKLPQK